jgi:hypothetical protein
MDDLITLDPSTVVVITAVIVPILVGFLTKLNAPAGLKAFVNLIVAALGTLAAQAMTEDGYAVVSQDMFKAWAVTTTISIATYYGVYKPWNVPNALAPSKGLGSGSDTPTP